ncbi:PAS domain S-box protein [Fulvivirga ulvae]|uniref:ATP-binding protein n=1 Tax=Fulvivirga ulvae TaxID=2904245 RepID=UPI001F1E7530|nr:ATP-binding protein [Fulvivirga ulvae]UII33269.1 PAS domain S-box protein [Fulvivirga ulvae]
MMNYEALFTHSPSPMVVASTEGVILNANIAFCELLGCSVNQLISTRISEYVYGEDIEEYFDLNKTNTDVKKKEQVTLHIKNKAAGTISVTCKSKMISDEQGLPLHQIITMNVCDNENIYLNALMSSFPGLIYFKDKDSRFLKVNKAYIKKFSVATPEDIIGKSDFDFFDEKHARNAYNAEQKIIKTGQPLLNVEEKEVWPDGHNTWVATTKMPLQEINGQTIGTYGISIGITEKKESEMKLREKTSILNAVTLRMPVVIYKFHVNEGLQIIMGNPRVKDAFMSSKIVKLSMEEGLASLVDKISDDDERHNHLHFNSTKDDQHFENFVFTSRSVDGEFIGLALDITDRKQARQKIKKNAKELEKINRELNQFAYIISHDLKAPLRAITNLSEWIEEDLGEIENDEIKENLRLLRSRVNRMENLINGILTYSRISRTKIDYAEVDTNEVVAEVIDSLLVPERFSITISGPLPVIRFPRVNLEQIFSNLISNAIKYHDKSLGNIEVGYKEKNSFHEFWVKDDGPGIAAEYHEKIFVIFQTLQARDTMESTGIGLTIVKKIVEDRGGNIILKSEPGKGTKFVFSIPKLIDDNGN